MAGKDGIITLKDIITNDALSFGDIYAKNVETAIKANEKLKQSAKGLSEVMDLYRSSDTNYKLIETKNKEKTAIDSITQALRDEVLAIKEITQARQEQLAVEKALDAVNSARKKTKSNDYAKALEEEALNHKKITNAIKEQELSEKALEKVKQEKNKTQKQEEAAIKRNTVLTEEEKIQNQLLRKEKALQARENLGLVGAYEKLNRERTKAQRVLADLLAAEEKDTRAIIKAQREYDVLNSRVQSVDKAVDIFSKNIGNYGSAFGGFGDLLQTLTAAFGVATGIQLFSDAVTKAKDILINYEKEVVNLAAIAGHTREEIKPLEDTIQDVAAASINSATDVAKLATELIKLGSTPEEAAKLLKPVNDLSLALQASAEDAATLVKSLLNAYGEGADQAARYTDVLAESANRSALDFQGLRDAFSYLAPTAKTLGFSLEKTAALLGVLADNGIKAESAGRLTSTALARLAGNGLTLEDALDKINKVQRESNDELKVAAVAADLFGAEALKVGIILANNREKIDENTIAYQNSRGALEELTNKQLKSLDAQLEILDSSFEDYIIKLNESTGFTDSFTKVVKFLASNLDTIIDVAFQAVAAFVVYKTVMLASSAATKIQTASIYAQILAQALMTNGIKGLRAELTALSATTKLNPYALIITATIGLIYYLTTLQKSLAQTTAETKKNTDAFLKNRDIQENNIDQTEKLADRYDELSGKVNLTTKEQTELAEITKVLGKLVPDATTNINKYGEALVISSDKIREYVKLQKEVLALKTDVELDKNVKLLSKLQSEQGRFNQAVDSSKSTQAFLESLGNSYKTINGRLSVRNDLLGTYSELSKEELLLFKQAALKNETEIAQTENRIKALKRLQDQAQATNKATTGSATPDATGKGRTIEVIDAEIKAEEDRIDSLTYVTRAEGQLIDKRVAALKKEREAIYSTSKAQKDAKKIREDYLANLKKTDEDAFNLAVFRLNRIKDQNDDVLENIDSGYQDQADAIIQNEAVLKAIAEENVEKRLKEISRYNDKVRDLTDQEISILINGGTIKKKLNNEEILALEQFQKEKQEIVLKGEKDIDALQLKNFEKNLKEQLRQNDLAINNDLIAENDRYNAEDITLINREVKTEEHEKKIAEIKKKYAIQALKDQIAAMEVLLSTETVTAEKRKEVETDISNKKKELSDLTLKFQTDTAKSYKELILGEELSEEGKKQRLIELAQELKDSLISLSTAIFDARIQKIDDEIAANEEYYNRQLELAGNDQRQKDLIEAEAEKKRQQLEKKKREEQRKQAVFEKALKITDVIASTALGIMQAYAQLGPILGNVGAAIVGAIGAIQLAAIIATPIPKYKGGRKGGPAETAIVGDGGVSEVIESTDGNVRYTPSKSTLVHLQQGDTVHSSKEAYRKDLRSRMLDQAERDSQRIQGYHQIMVVEKNHDKLEAKIEAGIDRGFKKAKININNTLPKIDIDHLFWARNNVKW